MVVLGGGAVSHARGTPVTPDLCISRTLLAHRGAALYLLLAEAPVAKSLRASHTGLCPQKTLRQPLTARLRVDAALIGPGPISAVHLFVYT